MKKNKTAVYLNNCHINYKIYLLPSKKASLFRNFFFSSPLASFLILFFLLLFSIIKERKSMSISNSDWIYSLGYVNSFSFHSNSMGFSPISSVTWLVWSRLLGNHLYLKSKFNSFLFILWICVTYLAFGEMSSVLK